MAILKSEIRNKFTTIPNSIIQECELSDGDFRLLVFLYSLPDGWKINQGYLGAKMNCSRVNVNKKVKRIKEAGYLEVLKSKGTNTDYIYVLKEKSVSPSDVSVNDVSPRDVSLSDTHINTNIIKTKKINVTTAKENLFSFVEEAFGRTLSSIEYEVISTWEDNELTRYAIKQAVLNGSYRVKYIEAILFRYKKDNIKTVAEAQEQEKRFKNQKNTIEPEWLNKNIQVEETSFEEQNELKEMLEVTK